MKKIYAFTSKPTSSNQTTSKFKKKHLFWQSFSWFFRADPLAEYKTKERRGWKMIRSREYTQNKMCGSQQWLAS
jgi:hypothetical protein